MNMLSSNSYKTFKNDRQNFVIIFALAAGILFFGSAQAQQPERNKLIERVVDNWLDVAQTQYERAMYVQAEKSLARAQEYYEFLNPKQMQSMNDLLNDIHAAMAEEQQFYRQLDGIDELISNNQLIRAKAELQQLKKNKQLNQTERQRVMSMLESVDGKIETHKFELQHLFEQSRQYYELGEMEKARSGFTEVADSGVDISYKGKTAGQYLVEIEKLQADNKQAVQSVDKPKPDKQKKAESGWLFQSSKDKAHKEKESSKTTVTGEKPKSPEQPKLQDKGQIQTSRNPSDSAKTSIRTSYAKALVRDAHLKVGRHLAQNELGKAKSVVTETRVAIVSFQRDIDPQTHQQLMAELDGLADTVLKQQGISE